MRKIAGYILKAGALSLLIAYPLFADAVIDLVGYSPQLITEMHLTTQRNTPLAVTGVGQPVYLNSVNAGTTYAWSITTKPSGSQAALSGTSTREVHFIPDIVGSYVVSLTVTDTITTTAEMTITGANYVGIGNIGGASPSFSKGQCAGCHADVAASWGQTNHATTLQRGISGTLSSHFGQNCVQCHSTGYDTLAVNGGFDDLAKTAGWTFPATMSSAQWDTLVTQHPDLAQLANVQCESCHGPGSLHKGNTSAIDVSYDAGVCNFCHDSKPYYPIPTQWRHSKHGTAFTPTEAFNRSGNTCVPCHTAEGFFEVNFASAHTAASPYKNGNGQTCQVCHDPHEKGTEHQLRLSEDYLSRDSLGVAKYKSDGTAAHACDVCHHLRPGNELVGARMHESHQSDMLNGTVGYRYAGKKYPEGLHGRYVTNRCVGCHMATASSDKSDYVGGHTFAVKATVTDSTGATHEYYNTQACTGCHADMGENFDYHGIQTRVTQLLDQIKAKLPLSSSGSPLYSTADYTSGKLTEKQYRAAYNWYVVNNDGSRGIHNPSLAVSLLEDALEDLGGPSTKTCDFTGDGKNNISDVIFFLLLRRADPEDSRLDYTGDGTKDIADAVALLTDIRNSTCPNKTTLLAAAGVSGVEPMEGLSAEEVLYVEQMAGQFNLTDEEKADLALALYGKGAGAALPKVFALAQNSPNPFNPSTTISYSVPEGQNGVQVRLDVYDLRGQRVRSLVNEARDAGTYTVFWNGTDERGGRVASGVYFYRLQAGGFVQTRKMVMLK